MLHLALNQKDLLMARPGIKHLQIGDIALFIALFRCNREPGIYTIHLIVHLFSLLLIQQVIVSFRHLPGNLSLLLFQFIHCHIVPNCIGLFLSEINRREIKPLFSSKHSDGIVVRCYIVFIKIVIKRGLVYRKSRSNKCIALFCHKPVSLQFTIVPVCSFQHFGQ